MPFTGITTNYTATYNSTTDSIDVVDNTDYAGQSFTRSQASITTFTFFRKSGGPQLLTTLVPNVTDPTTVVSWNLPLNTAEDGWRQFVFIYGFAFSDLATHQRGDVVIDSGTYYIYVSATPSANPVTSSDWEVLAESNYTLARISHTEDILITRNSEKCVQDREIEFSRLAKINACRIDCDELIKLKGYLKSAVSLFELDSKSESQEFIEALEVECEECEIDSNECNCS